MPSQAAIDGAADRRARILERIRSDVATRRYPPSVTELAREHDVSRRQIDLDLDELVKAGLIERDRGVSRGLRIASPAGA